MDDTGFPKQGAHSVGLARQYSGTLGKAANCQIAVTLQQGAHESVWGVAAELYLPKAWQDDPDRMTQAGVPDEIGYRPKWQMALQMLDRAQHNGLEALCSLTACTAVCMHSASNWMNGEGPLAWGSTAH
jgi:SRSO17 transposase